MQFPAVNKTLTITTPSPTTVVMTRTFKAPRRLVWEALTDPAKQRRWMFTPPGCTMTVCEFDARLGGRYRWAWKTEQADPMMVIHGEMTEVVPFERITHTQVMDMSGCGGGVATFDVGFELSDGAAGSTAWKLTLTFPDTQARDAALQWGMEDGMEPGYAALDAMLAAGV